MVSSPGPDMFYADNFNWSMHPSCVCYTCINYCGHVNASSKIGTLSKSHLECTQQCRSQCVLHVGARGFESTRCLSKFEAFLEGGS